MDPVYIPAPVYIAAYGGAFVGLLVGCAIGIIWMQARMRSISHWKKRALQRDAIAGIYAKTLSELVMEVADLRLLVDDHHRALGLAVPAHGESVEATDSEQHKE